MTVTADWLLTIKTQPVNHEQKIERKKGKDKEIEGKKEKSRIKESRK